MTNNKFKIPLKARVRLKPEVADVYPAAFAGAEGIIENHRIDPLGEYPMVYIKWDKNHWTYNGEDDLWTFEDHFEVVETPSKAPPTQEAKVVDSDDILKQISDLLGEAQKRRSEAPDSPPNKEEEGFDTILSKALDSASESEAFLLISVNKETNPYDPNQHVLIPHIFSSYGNEIAGLLLEAQLSQLAAHSHQEIALELIRMLLGGPDEPRR